MKHHIGNTAAAGLLLGVVTLTAGCRSQITWLNPEIALFSQRKTSDKGRKS